MTQVPGAVSLPGVITLLLHMVNILSELGFKKEWFHVVALEVLLLQVLG